MEALAIAGLWVLFVATHMGLSSRRLRSRLTERLGPLGFQWLYSLIALGIFVPLVPIYFRHKHEGPYLGRLIETPELRWMMYIGMGATFAMAVAGLEAVAVEAPRVESDLVVSADLVA